MMMVLLAVSFGFFAVALLTVSARSYVVLTIAYILFLPKIGVLVVPGTWVAIRGEDLLVALLLIRVIFDFAIGNLKWFDTRVSRMILVYLLLIPIGIIALAVGTQNGSIEALPVGILFLLRKFEYFVFFIAGYAYLGGDKDPLSWMMKTIKVAVVFHFCVALLQTFGFVGGFIRGGTYQDISDGRVTSTFSGAYEFGGVLAMIAPAFLWTLIRTSAKVSSASYLALIGVSVVLTQSRSSIFVYFAVLIVMLFVMLRRHRVLVVTAGILGAGLFMLTQPSVQASGRFATISPTLMFQESVQAWNRRSYANQLQFGTAISDLSSDLSFSFRAGRWFNYIDGVLDFNPLFGLGPSAGGEAVDGNYVRLIIEFGFLGIITFGIVVGFIWSLLRQTTQSGLWAIAAWGGLTLLAQAIFIDIFEASKVAELYWLVLGVVLASGLKPATYDCRSSGRPKKLKFKAAIPRTVANNLTNAVASTLKK